MSAPVCWWPLTQLLATDPGVYLGMPDAIYHADPVQGGSLSSTGARMLLPPSCPAKYRWWRDHGQDPKPVWDIGHAAHHLVLGTGPELVLCDYDSWRTNAAKADRDEAYARGAVPLLPPTMQLVTDMANALRAHPVARALFDPDHGVPEAALIWRDHQTGIMCRARFDWLPEQRPGRLIIPDYKTAAAADVDSIARSAATYGYHVQNAWYEAGARALGLGDERTAFVFVVQEKDPPYLVHIVEPDHVAKRIGVQLNRQALTTLRACQRDDRWPGYATQNDAGVDEITQLTLPTWYERQFEDR